jgi:hypothetical protein
MLCIGCRILKYTGCDLETKSSISHLQTCQSQNKYYILCLPLTFEQIFVQTIGILPSYLSNVNKNIMFV